MAAPKSSISALLLLLVTVVSLQSQVGDAQNCSTQLSNLNACSPFLVPGNSNPNPNADCCNALQAVQHDCICNTIQIAKSYSYAVQSPTSPMSCTINKWSNPSHTEERSAVNNVRASCSRI